ncbi:segregation and condensation protein A [Natronospira proteinivora]|uniref:Segregation and condensation protein A n=2 Tax=Natronospira proteinivora TaxID=1807133 RepID=A0ABT1G6L8_9GAMM|nr:segregation and condensation protein A [Natronospira proteinivora]
MHDSDKQGEPAWDQPEETASQDRLEGAGREAEPVVGPVAEEGTQEEMPFALVQGEPYTTLPKDLYIPPDALEVFLEAFEGPLDLLLYLIKRQNLDICNIPIAQITTQYMQYVELMKELRLELAAEYLVMAAMLAEIKSRMLLPRPSVSEEEEGDDPRAELIRRLQEYERYKTAAEDIDAMPRMGRDVFQAEGELVGRKVVQMVPEVTLKELMVAFKDVLKRADMFQHHHVQRESLSVRQRMSEMLSSLESGRFREFTSLFPSEEGRMGVVVTFMALLELVKEQLVEIIQAELYAPIHVRASGAITEAENPEAEPPEDGEQDNDEPADDGQDSQIG